jgi:hypothetical protein
MMVPVYDNVLAEVEGLKTYQLLAYFCKPFREIIVVIKTCPVCAVMSDPDQLQMRAARLLAIALKAREEGHLDFAERFTQRASEILDHPTALERLGTKSGEKVKDHPEPDKDRDKE